MSLTLIQTEIKRALEGMGERSKFTDAQLAKKLRELCKIDGRKKAVLALGDILAAMDELMDEDSSAGGLSGRNYRITVTNANDLLIERYDEPSESVVTLEAKQRRQRHEKSQMLFTNGDVVSQADGELVANGGRRNRGYHRGEKRAGRGQRTERMSLNVNRDYSDSE